MREFIILEETSTITQEKIRQWLSTGYDIEIISQTSVVNLDLGSIYVITSLWRIKK